MKILSLLQSLPEIRNYEEIGLKSFLIFLLLLCLYIIWAMQKDHKEIIIRKEAKIDKLIEDTSEDYKRIITDGNKDKIDIKVLLEKTSTLLSEVRNVLHNRHG